MVRYFSALVKNETVAAQRQEDYMAAMRALNPDPLAVHLGRFKSRTIGPCRRNVGHFFIRESALNRAQMPGVLEDPAGGRSYRRPEKWS